MGVDPIPMNTEPSDLLPLATSHMHILMALVDGAKHGYAIMQEVETLTERSVTMGPGTLYGAIKRMLQAGLVEESDERPDPALDDERRRYYRITDLGTRLLDAEVHRMEQISREARMRMAGAASSWNRFHD